MKTLSLPLSLEHPGHTQDRRANTTPYLQALIPRYSQLHTNQGGEDVLLIPDEFPLTPTRRLVVIVPPGEIDETALIRRVWELAYVSGFQVLYLSLAADITQTAYQRRRLADMAAFTSLEKVQAHAVLSPEKNWRQALDEIARNGDLVVCLSGYRLFEPFFWRRKVGTHLVKTTGLPVFVLGGFKIGLAPWTRQSIRDGVAWTVFLGLIAVFFGLQASIERFTAGSLSTVLICLTIFVEIFLLWKINEWIG